MNLGIGDNWPLIQMTVMQYTGTDPETIAVCDAFNAWFSVSFTFGTVSFLCVLLIALMARS